jgi:hypothetical protein
VGQRFTAREWSELADQRRRNELERTDKPAWQRENGDRLLRAVEQVKQKRKEEGK